MKMLSSTKAMLKEFHRNLNEELAQLLQDDQFTWPELTPLDMNIGPDTVNHHILPVHSE